MGVLDIHDYYYMEKGVGLIIHVVYLVNYPVAWIPTDTYIIFLQQFFLIIYIYIYNIYIYIYIYIYVSRILFLRMT